MQATLEHQIEVARRPKLAASVVEAILARGEPAVLTALASNNSAEISPDGMRKLVDRAREVVALRSPLARHPRLSSDLAEQLYLWVGRALRDALTTRFHLDPATMASARTRRFAPPIAAKIRRKRVLWKVRKGVRRWNAPSSKSWTRRDNCAQAIFCASCEKDAFPSSS